MVWIRAPAVTPPSNAGIPGRKTKMLCAAGQLSLHLEKSAHSSEDPAQSKKENTSAESLDLTAHLWNQNFPNTCTLESWNPQVTRPSRLFFSSKTICFWLSPVHRLETVTANIRCCLCHLFLAILDTALPQWLRRGEVSTLTSNSCSLVLSGSDPGMGGLVTNLRLGGGAGEVTRISFGRGFPRKS